MATAVMDRAYLDHPDCTDLDHIPGSDGLPHFGNSLRAIWGLPSLVEDHYRQWGEVSRIKILLQRSLRVLARATASAYSSSVTRTSPRR